MLKDKQEEIKILSTTDYGIFNKLLGNREYNKGLLVVLEESILNDGDYLRFNPILVNEKMEVIDGQHRLKKAEDLEKPIFYIIGHGLTLRHAQIFNSRKRGWVAKDFLQSYLAEGKRDYQILDDFCKEYKFSIAIGVKFLTHSRNQEGMRLFREGKLYVKDIAFAENAAGLLSTIRDHTPDYCYAQSSCQNAVMRMIEVLPKPRVFEEKLNQYQTTITRRNSLKDYLKEFQLILDMGQSSGVKLI